MSLFLLNMFNIMKNGYILLAFDLSAKVAHIGVPSICSNIVFSETTKPVDVKFYMETP